MLINPWKFKKIKTMLFDRIGELNANLRNQKELVTALKAQIEAQKAHNQLLTRIILDSDQRDNFSVADLSML
jgi:hypothetical protein